MDALAQLVGESPGLVAIREQVRRILQRQSESRRMPPVLIQGETGTGKGLVARAMHSTSARAGGPFVDVNCAAIPETLLEAEMFGVERGAFTDARQAKPGLFQLAHRGTIFLDEIGLLPEALQAKLLKVIEERAVRRVGGTRSEPVDVWVVAATNEDLAAAVRERRYRADLYHRLAVVTLSLPALRERADDVLLLAEHFLARACADYGIPAKTLTPAARAALRAYPWPGNIRELSNVMERVALLSEAREVTPEMLALPAAAPSAAPGPERAEPGRTLEAAVDDVEREHLLAALRETDWNVTRAAMRLGISRNTLRYRIEKHGLRPGAAPPRRRGTAAPAAPSPAVTPGAAPAAAPAGPARERRRLALLRAALSVPPGADAPLVSRRALELLGDKARAFGGRVEELSTSGLVAAFGVEPVEDAPVRAANAALAIVNGVERARRSEGLNAGVRAAVHVDHFFVAAGTAGPAIEVEARPHVWAFLDALLESADADGIVISEAAAPFIERRFDLAPAGGAGRAFRLAGRERPGVGVPGRTAAFVGRHHELELLRGRFASAARGQGHVIGIAGEAGIGKSRLLHELRRSLAGQPVTWLEGRCLSYSTAIPYAPVLDIVRGACHVVEGDTPETTAAKVAATLRDVDMDPAASAPYLLHLLGIKGGSERLAAQTPEENRGPVLETLRQLVVRTSRVRPVVLVVEDLHWIDRASEECFSSLADVVVGAPLLLVSTYRPGYRPPWIDRSYATQMALQPLDPEAGKAVVRSALGHAAVDEADVETILMKGEGNPFFLEELARAVSEVGGRDAALQVPATIREVVLARIDRLPPIEKHVLQCAAVVGKEAPIALVQAIAGLPEDALRDALARLRRAELLYETSAGRDAQHTFKHALTHEVAYDSLLEHRRRALHAAIVEAAERRDPARLDDHAERLAHHAFQGELWDRAVGYLRRAGARAAARSAHREAVGNYERALLALTRLPESPATLELGIDIRFDLRTSLTPLGEHRLIHDYLAEAEALAERLGDQRRIARVSAYMADYYRLMGRYDDAVGAGERTLAIARALGDFVLQLAGTMYVGQAQYNLGRYREAADLFARNVEALAGDLARERFGFPYVASVHSRTWMVWCLSELGDFAEAIARGEEALAIAESVGHPFSLTSAYAGLGRPYLRRGDVDRAAPILEAGLALSRRWNIHLLAPALAADLALAHAMAGRVAEAVPLLEQAVQRHASMRGTAGQSIRYTMLGDVLLRSGRRDDAGRLAARALELARTHHERGSEAYALRLLGEVAAAGSPPDDAAAEERHREALALARALGMRPFMAWCYLALAGPLRRGGKGGPAREAATAAVELFRALGMPRGLEAAVAEMEATGGRP